MKNYDPLHTEHNGGIIQNETDAILSRITHLRDKSFGVLITFAD